MASSTLLTLPVEIRQKIYDLVLGDVEICLNFPQQKDCRATAGGATYTLVRKDPHHPQIPLRGICRMIRSDVLSFLGTYTPVQVAFEKRLVGRGIFDISQLPSVWRDSVRRVVCKIDYVHISLAPIWSELFPALREPKVVIGPTWTTQCSPIPLQLPITPEYMSKHIGPIMQDSVQSFIATRLRNYLARQTLEDGPQEARMWTATMECKIGVFQVEFTHPGVPGRRNKREGSAFDCTMSEVVANGRLVIAYKPTGDIETCDEELQSDPNTSITSSTVYL